MDYASITITDDEGTPNIKSIGFDNENCCYFAVGYIGNTDKGCIYKSYNITSWGKVYAPSVRCNKIVINNDYIIIGNNNTVLKITDEKLQNVINNISSDSDINFNLKKGENVLKMTQSSGEAFVLVTYRQKYIGV